MSEDPGLEPWLANGFPPPSFVVETERVTVGGGGPPLQSRLLVGGAILGAVLLIAGLILMAQSGGDDDETALNTAPPTPTSSIPVVSFPPATGFEGSSLIPEETVPPPTFPPAAQFPIFPLTPAPAPAPGPGTTQGPPPTKKPDGPTNVATPGTTTTTTTTTTASPGTTTAATPPKIESLGVQPPPGGDRCSGGEIRAMVTDMQFVSSVTVTILLNGVSSDQRMLPENPDGTRSGIWGKAAFGGTDPGTTVKLTLKAVNRAGLSDTAEETFRCP